MMPVTPKFYFRSRTGRKALPALVDEKTLCIELQRAVPGSRAAGCYHWHLRHQPQEQL
jgi:hypothetical protein